MKRYDFRGRTAVITGAASGIGRALAVELATRGAHLALADRNEAGLIETVRLATSSGVRISSHLLDLADAAAIAAFPAEAGKSHAKIDIVINNAGVALGGSFEQVDPRDFEWLFEINFWGVVRMTRAFLPLLRAGDDALLVNVSSIFGIIAPPGQTAYSASKFAVRGFSQSLRAELSGTNVGVCVVYPGGVATSIAKEAREPKSISREESHRAQRQWAKMLKMPPHEAAAIIVRGMEHRKARILVGSDAKIAALAERLAPVSYGKLLRLLAGG
jgi:short-subunit dehydrogenase